MSYITDRMGLRAGDRLLLVDAPRGYLGSLAPVPEDVAVTGDLDDGAFDLVQVFVDSEAALESHLSTVDGLAGRCRRLWVAIPTAEADGGATVDRATVATTLGDRGWDADGRFRLDPEWEAVGFVRDAASTTG